jgi:hypothetical protein
MQSSLDMWRRQMIQMQKEGRVLTEDFRDFFAATVSHDLSPLLEWLKDEVDTSSKDLFEKITLTQTALRADMGLLESRRGIAEAESVARLTELAFIFIPLSFVASLFSMQIKELSDGVPVQSFIAAAFTVLAIIYGIRIAIRARPIVKARRVIMSQARTFNSLQPNDPIPAFGFIRFCVVWILVGTGQVWAFWLFLSALSITVIPTVLLWTRSGLDVSFKAIGTIIFVPAGFLFAWMLASFLSTSDLNPAWSFLHIYDTLTKKLFPRLDRNPGRWGRTRT